MQLYLKLQEASIILYIQSKAYTRQLYLLFWYITAIDLCNLNTNNIIISWPLAIL